MYSSIIKNKYKQYQKLPVTFYHDGLYKEVINRQREVFYEIVKKYQENKEFPEGKPYNFKIEPAQSIYKS